MGERQHLGRDWGVIWGRSRRGKRKVSNLIGGKERREEIERNGKRGKL
jgi:hypothetical protein